MKNFKVGLQLFSIREEMAENMDSALKQVKEMGYDYVEFAGFFDKSADEVLELLKKYDLNAISVHQGPELFLEQGQEAIDYLKKIGVKYCAIPWYEKEKLKGTEFWDETVKLFNDYGKALKKSDINLLYHNHDFEFNTYEGKTLFDWIYETIPSDIINPEMDVCWISYSGNNPSEYIRKYSGKMDVLHLKDFECTKLGGGPVYGLIDKNGKEMKPKSKEEIGFVFKPIGYGIQNFEEILNYSNNKEEYIKLLQMFFENRRNKE